MDGSSTASHGPRGDRSGGGAAREGTFDLLRAVLADGSALLRADLRLAAAESAASGRRLAYAAVLAVVALVLSGGALNLLAIAAVAGVAAAGQPVWISALIVAAAVLVFMIAALLFAVQLARKADPVPKAALARMRRDLESIAEAASNARQ